VQNIDRDLVIIGSNEYCEKDGKYYFRSGLEPQMEHLAQYFKNCYHYSPTSEFSFDGFEFSNQVTVRPFSLIHHRNHKELWSRKGEYLESIKNIYNEHKSAIFMVYIPDSYIGLISAYYLKKVNANWFTRVTSDQLKEMKVRGGSLVRRVAYYFLRPIHILFMKWLLHDIIQIYTGNKLFYNNKYTYSVNSSNLTLTDIKDKKFIRNDVFKLLYVGRFDQLKGINFLIDSLSKLSLENYKLDIIGFDTNENKDKLLKLINNSDKKEKINFIGQVKYGEELFSYYDKADILILPSLQETQGKTHLEAMARGVSVIATNVGGIPNIVKHNITGILVKPSSSIEIKNAIEVLYYDKKLQKNLIKNGYKMAKNSTIDKITDLTIKVLIEFNIGSVNDTNS
jgi:glycosyltransferase involved in cell wall biosynthesis